MTKPVSLDFPIRKAEYLFNHTTDPGEGGDKRKFWQEIMGFETAENIREAILAEISLNLLRVQTPNEHGDRYEAIVTIAGQSGKVRFVRTIWIVRFGEDVARFVTAVPRQRKPG